MSATPAGVEDVYAALDCPYPGANPDCVVPENGLGTEHALGERADRLAAGRRRDVVQMGGRARANGEADGGVCL